MDNMQTLKTYLMILIHIYNTLILKQYKSIGKMAVLINKEKFKIHNFLPVSTFLIFWYFLIMLLLLLDFLLTVIIICYRNESASHDFRFYLLPIVVIAFFLDIIISFNTGFIKNGKIIRVRK